MLIDLPYETGGAILIVTYSMQGKLCVYRVQVKWETAPVDPGQQKQPGFSPPHAPVIQIIHVKTETPKTVFTKPIDHNVNFTSMIKPISNLTHLEIINVSSDSSSGGSNEPYILAVFSAPIPTLETQQQPNSASSILVRWDLRSASQSLHDSFDEVPPRRPTHHLKHRTELVRQNDMYLDQRVLSIDHFEAGNVIALTFDNGNIKFFDAKTVLPSESTDNLTVISNLPQAGFSFPTIGSATCISFSPCGCLAVTLDENSALQLHAMELSLATEDGLYRDGARNGFVTEIYQALSMNTDFTIEQDKLMNNPYIQKCLSMQAALGFNGQFQPRSLTAALSWFILQLRQISILFAYFLHFNKSGSDSECHEPGMVPEHHELFEK
ncbi:predicted protein [Uncinocarpus reesii 1704]|uniref:Mediator of RNA polymerase II transcription subunit 16 n=1 Tax=Uncinocarpus reesii (strain UAMH 1704) TaxID=336963 RepID=C4JQS6_UNCRE|nr:uncharacterized protein UREG_03408 [Uncinocarpus reesii 1704]EEP78562.1 predicted protein [Uncinocarpus reesii 1704]